MTLLLEKNRQRRSFQETLAEILNKRTPIEPPQEGGVLMCPFDRSGSMDSKTVWNICADIAINDLLQGVIELPEGSILPEDLDLPPGAKAEDYYLMMTDGFEPDEDWDEDEFEDDEEDDWDEDDEDF